MDKNNLERFIAKYHLGGLVGPITIVSDGTTISVRCATDNKNTVVQLSSDVFPLERGEYHIFDTAQFKSLLSVLGSDIEVKTKTSKNGVPTSLLISDVKSKVTVVLADASAIPAAPTLKSIPPMEETFVLSSDFISRFLKSASAISNALQFAVRSNETGASAIINYSETQNTSRIEIPFGSEVKKTLKTTYFLTEQMSAILSANKEATKAYLSIASNISNGIAQLKFDLEGYTVTYYLVGAKPE